MAATRQPSSGSTTSALTSSAGPIANAIIAARTPDQYDAEGSCECTRNAHAAFSSVGSTNDARKPTTIQ